MATVKNYSLAGVSTNLQFGKAGGKIDFAGGAFTVTDVAGTPVELTAATPAAADNTTKVATTAFVQTELSNFNDDRIESPDTNTSVVTTDGAINGIVNTVSQFTVTNGKFDLLSTTQLSASDGSAAAPGLAFDAAAGEQAGLFFDPIGSVASGNEVGMSVEGFALETWALASGAVDPVTLNNEMSDTEAKISATGTAANIDIRLTPKGTGQVFIGDAGAAATIGSGDSQLIEIDAEDMVITGGDGFAGSTSSAGGNIQLSPGNGVGAGADGIVDIQDDDGQSVMKFIGVDSAVNFLTATNAALGNRVIIASDGVDTDIDIVLSPKGAGVIYAAGSLIKNVLDPVDLQDAATKKFVDDSITAIDKTRIQDTGTTTFVDTDAIAGQVSITAVNNAVFSVGGFIDAGTSKISNVVDPTALQDAATKNFVDNAISAVTTTGAEDLIGFASGETIVDGVSIGGAGVNFLEISNAATGSGPTLKSEGADANIDLSLSGKGTGVVLMSNSVRITGTLDMNDQFINNLADPVADTDAANKRYVDTVAQGLVAKDAVHVATVAGDVTGATYSGTDADAFSGVGDTLTAAGNGILFLDGLNGSGPPEQLAVSQRVLVKDHANPKFNGIYTITDLGSGATPWILTRSTDADNSPAGEIPEGTFTFVEFGVVQAATGWTLIGAGSGIGNSFQITFSGIDGDDLNFSQFSGAGAFTVVGGAAITSTQDGTDFTVDVNVDDATIRVNGADNLAVSGGSADVTNKLLTGAAANTDATWNFLGDLRDTAGLLSLSTIGIASAVNNLTATNAALGGMVILGAEGTDTNISLRLAPKGTGTIYASGAIIANVGEPTAPAHAATKNFVDLAIGAISTTSIVDGTSDLKIDDTADTLTLIFNAGAATMVVSPTLMDVDVAIQGIDGTAAAPAYSFESNVTSGMFFTATGAAAFAEGGAAALELGLEAATSNAQITALGTNGNIKLVPNGTGFIDASSSLISNVITPIADSDAATKGYVDSEIVTASAGDVRTLKSTFSLTALGTFPFITAIPAGATVTSVRMKVTTASDTATTVAVGIAGDTDKYQLTTENDPQLLALYISEIMELEGAAVTPDVVIATPGTIGSVDVIIEFRAA